MILRNSLLGGILIVLLTGVAGAQISPGPLARAHKSLDGTTQCSSCHKLGGGEAVFKCLDCHTEIASRLNAHSGLHATYHMAPGSSQDCARCHSDHNGVDFQLIKWDRKTFDHRQTGYALEGKHAGLECNKCHLPERISAADRTLIKYKDLSKSFLGISTACITCHKDPHNGRLGQDCLHCHNYNDWKVNETNFDHSKTRYPLTGQHAPVACNKCHTPGNDGKPRWVGIPFGKCDDCHADPHHGSFPEKSCDLCHNTFGWKRVATQPLNQTFDHSKTKYPLEGKHQQVECVACHAKGDFMKHLAFAKCLDCHKDEHQGQFVKRADKGECKPCHTLEGWKPTKYSVKDHATSLYPLEAKHAQVKCEGCHIPKGKETVYKLKFDRCMVCHKDEHQTQFAGAPFKNLCEKCHTLNGWEPSTYTIKSHKEARFVLTGGHIAVACSDCHKPRSTPEAKYAVLYHFDDNSCTACHKDPHNGQFKDRMRAVGTDGSAIGCEACHSTKSWKDLARFDHSKTDFPLIGTHRVVACIDCHKPPNLETKLTNVDYKAAPKVCEECHTDIHGAQFAKADRKTPCDDCHNNSKFKPSTFDHDTRTPFPLTGVHKNVRCDGCHKEVRKVADKSVLFYKPTPKECVACHGPEIKKS